MKRHKDLFDKVVSFNNLLLATKKASKGKKMKKSIASFYFDMENEIINLKTELENGSYHPRDYTQFEIKEPKTRQICSSHFRDRVVHHAICNFVEPILENRCQF